MAVVYVPAGLEGYVTNNHVSYSGPAIHDRERSIYRDGEKIWELFDRTVGLKSYSTNNFQPISNEEYVYASSNLGPSCIKNAGIKIILINPHSKKIIHNQYKDAGIKTIMDSGGFQLLMGVKDFIDPLEVVSFYNNKCDIGMDLDIPIGTGVNHKQLEALAKIQKENYKRMLAHKEGDFEFCLVNHGITVKERDIHYDIIGRKNPKYISIAGMVQLNPGNIDPELYIAEVILHTASRYPNVKYIHCLGLTRVYAVLVYCIVDLLNIVHNIGGDSVSYIMNDIGGVYQRLFNFVGMNIPKNFYQYTKAPCSCPICTTVNDMRLIISYNGRTHNMLMQKYYWDHLYSLVSHYLNGEIKTSEFINLSGLQITERRVKTLVDYCKDFVVNGFTPLKRVNSKSLFADNAIYPNTDKYNSIIKRYEKYYSKRFL